MTDLHTRSRTSTARRVVAAFTLLVAVLTSCTSGGEPVTTPTAGPATPSPSPAPPPDPCEGEGWDEVPVLALDDGRIRSLSVVVTRSDGSLSHSLAGSRKLHARVEVAPGSTAPTLYLDLDGRGSGAWTLGSAVSVAAWDLRVGRDGVERHAGTSGTDWSWEAVDVQTNYRWSPDTGVLLVCLPTELLGRRHRVAFGVETGDRWLPRALLPGIPYPPVREDASVPLRAPARLAISYGYRPWVIRGCTDPDPDTMSCASDVYAAFRHVVLAAGLEDPAHPSHGGTRRLIEQLRADHADQELWGYVSLRRHAQQEHTLEDIATRAAAWQQMGITGIFLDEADLCPPGPPPCTEAGITREFQSAAIGAIHALGLPVFANGFSAPDLLHPFSGVPPALGAGSVDRPADMYLLENPTMAGGEWRTGVEADATVARLQAAIRAAAELGVRLAAVDTAGGAVGDDSAHPGYVAGWWRAVQAGADAYGFTNTFYSATDELGPDLPVLDPPVPPDRLAGLAFDTLRLRVSDGGRRVSRDVVDCNGADVGAVVTRTSPDGSVTGELAVREGATDCP